LTNCIERAKVNIVKNQSRTSYFAQRVVYPWERPSIMRKHIYTGAMGNVWAHLISGIFFVYFGTEIGLTRFQWGLMAGISSWLIGAQLISARLSERTGRRKQIWFWLAMADRGLRMAGILGALGLWMVGSPTAPVVLVLAICLANLLGTMGSPPWLSWLADLVPEEEHGAFWGKRSMWIAAATIAAIVPAGFVMDRIGEDHKLYVAVGIFAAATALGLADLLIHGTIPEPVAKVADRSVRRTDLLEPLRDSLFRPWLVFNAFWTFGMTLGGALGTLYFVTELGIRRNFLGGTLVLTSFALLGDLLTSRISGRLVDRFGVKRVLFGGHLFWATLPLFWLVATPETALVLLGAASLIGGSGTAAALNAATKFVTRMPVAEKRASYIAVSSTVGNIAGGLGVILAGIFLQLLADRAPVEFLTRTGNGFRALFALSLLLRVGSTVLLVPRIREKALGAPGK
jgi:MFS family permease